ncbi:MAG: isochorismatase family cysteine hydrolase, partial [Promethearchaeota archaeon]
ALIIWDVQNLLVSNIFNKREFIENLKIILTITREKKVPVIYSKKTILPRTFHSPAKIYGYLKRFGINDSEKLSQFLLPGSPEAEIYSVVAPHDEDMVLPNHTASIFTGTIFDNLMKNLGIKTILFTGISAESDVSFSVRDASNKGFFSVVLEDCVSSRDEEMYKAVIKVLNKISIVIPSVTLIDKWK